LSDELKVVLVDVKEKFHTVIEAFNMVTERLDRYEQAEEERFNRLENDMLEIGKDIRDLRQDLNEHRNNTELHTAKREKAC
jgi:hypothetical protein